MYTIQAWTLIKAEPASLVESSEVANKDTFPWKFQWKTEQFCPPRRLLLLKIVLHSPVSNDSSWPLVHSGLLLLLLIGCWAEFKCNCGVCGNDSQLQMLETHTFIIAMTGDGVGAIDTQQHGDPTASQVLYANADRVCWAKQETMDRRKKVSIVVLLRFWPRNGK